MRDASNTTFADRLKYGKKGELIVASYLSGKGYTIYHTDGTEQETVDLIARRGNKTIFIEVKTKNKLKKIKGVALDHDKVLKYSITAANTEGVEFWIMFIETVENKLYTIKVNDILKDFTDSNGDTFPNMTVIKDALVVSIEQMTYIKDLDMKEIDILNDV